MNKNKNLGFTLAEVLIVIGIIGVVAALTLPNLNHATGDKEKVTKVKKIYSALTEAVDRAQATYGPFDTWFKDLNTTAEKSERFAKRVTEFMKISKDCRFDEGCFSSGPSLFFYGDVYEDDYLSLLQSENRYMVMLSDGISLAFRGGEIKVDINGPNKGKNQEGEDLFAFEVNTNDGTTYQIFPDRFSNTDCDLFDNSCNGNCHGYYTAWVIENGNLDYLKCYDELNWETKTSCE